MLKFTLLSMRTFSVFYFLQIFVRRYFEYTKPEFTRMFVCFSSLKLVYIFSVNPYLGPLQVSLSRMVLDIMKFFFLYVLVLFAFSCG